MTAPASFETCVRQGDRNRNPHSFGVWVGLGDRSMNLRSSGPARLETVGVRSRRPHRIALSRNKNRQICGKKPKKRCRHSCYRHSTTRWKIGSWFRYAD